jgi:hypothetical protein
MKKTIKRKKYGTGTSVKNYMDNPSTVLAKNSINLTKASGIVDSNPFTNAMSLLGNMGMQAAMSSDSFDTDMGGESQGNLARAFAPMLANMAFGGTVPGAIPVEVEGKEVAKTPDGQLIDFEGPSHEKGGIDVDLPEGTDVFSKRIKVAGKTMAERKLKREAKEYKFSKQLEDNKYDMTLKKTLKRTKENNALEEEKDQRLQELISQMKEITKLAFGTGKEGIRKKLKDGEKGLGIPKLTVGDSVSIAGSLFSAFAPMANTKAARGGDTPNINAYEGFGEDALATLDSASGMLSSQQDKALKDLDLSRNTAIKRNRNSSRGVNTSRALDIATDENINKAEGDIYDNFSKQMMQMLSQKAGFENEQDNAVMSGEQQRDLADRQDRDNYFSNMAEDISTKGQGIQQIGKMLNQNKANTMAEKAINDASVNFKYTNGVLTDKNGTVKMTKAELDKAARKGGFVDEDGNLDIIAYVKSITQNK